MYSPAEAGVSEWPDGQLRLDGATIVTDPKEADVFVCPGPLLLFPEPEHMDRFPYMAGNEERHVFFDISESLTIYKKPCVFIRTNLKTWMKAGDPNSVSFPWPVENYAECIDVPEGGFTHDISFHGWLNYSTRADATQSCKDAGLRCDMALYSDFTGHIYYSPEGIRRRAEFRNSMRRCRLALCPESIPGDFPYRFFEAMSAGRVPVLVGRNQVFPFADEIPYSEFILNIDLDDQRRTGLLVQQFLEKHNDEEIVRMGKLAREYWLKYLNRDDFPRTMTYVVAKHLVRLGLTAEPVPCL